MGGAAPAAGATAGREIEESFRRPPDAAKVWVYWWWLNGCVTRDGIVRDLDHMKNQGISGALIFHAGEGETPWRTEFMSPDWRELFKFTVTEAARRGIVITLNLCAGWNLGGPWVKAEDAVQTLGFKSMKVRGGATKSLNIPAPMPAKVDDIGGKLRREAGATTPLPALDFQGYYRDVAVLAWQFGSAGKEQRAVCRLDTFVDLTDRRRGDQLAWEVPTGDWIVVRFGHYVGSRAFTKCTGGGVAFEIDPLRPDVMDRHFAATAGVLVQDVKEHVGKTFQHVHVDSGETGKPDWTPAFVAEFRKRRGYDPLPYLAARAGLIVDHPEVTERFNQDFERTLGDLMTENYYGRLNELARRHGLGTHSEAAGYQKPCVDALAALGCNDISMSEFWERRFPAGDDYIHQLTETQVRNHDGVRTAASAGHTYGLRIVQAEAFSVMREKTSYPNWIRSPFDLKDLGDRAYAAGMNRIVLHQFVHQPEENSQPGYKWPGVGNEFDRHVTWAPLSQYWLTYLARCQSLLQAGDFVADACYFQGEWIPSFIPARWAMNPALPAGFDCDAVNAGILSKRAKVDAEARLSLSGGMAYRYLVLNQGGRWKNLPWPVLAGQKQPGKGLEPATVADLSPQPLAISPAVLAQIKILLEAGLTLVGPPPARAIGLTDYPRSDQEVLRLAQEIWGASPAPAGERKVGRGRVIWGKELSAIFRADGLSPDLEIQEDTASQALSPATLSGIPNPEGSFSWIHRRIGGMEAYFIANLRNARTGGDFTFRVKGRQPELWNAVTGETRDLPEFVATADGRVRLPLRFEARQSFFVVFRRAQEGRGAESGLPPGANFTSTRVVAALEGAWEVAFDPKWGGPPKEIFAQLEDWSKRSEPGIKFYSGTATYRKSFTLPPTAIPGSQPAIYLDLGVVKNVARVRLNGLDLGGVWTAPWRVAITRAVKAGTNQLEIDVINLWPNRLIGDAGLTPEKRLTRTNVTGFRSDMPLLPSGLLGPVTLQVEE